MNSGVMTEIPGFVDLQVNGYKGIDFSRPDLSSEQVRTVSQSLFEQGTAAFLPTIITSPTEVYRRNLRLLGTMIREKDCQGRMPGIHLEGPFLSPKKGYIGTHERAEIRPPDTELLENLWEWSLGTIRLLTLAAEYPGAASLTASANEKGIAVSTGHSAFTPADLQRFIDAGGRAVTHLGNGIPNRIDRHRNQIWTALAEDRISALIIADGFHVPDPMLTVFLRAKGSQRLIAVSDISPIAGCRPGITGAIRS